MLRSTLICAVSAAALLAPAQATATTVKGSGTYQFEDPNDPLTTIKVNAKSNASGASGTVTVKEPGAYEPWWRSVKARVTCLRTAGNRVMITGTVTKVSHPDKAAFAYLTLVTEPRGAAVGLDSRPRWCNPDPFPTHPLGPLVRGKGIVPR